MWVDPGPSEKGGASGFRGDGELPEVSVSGGHDGLCVSGMPEELHQATNQG